MSSLHGPVKSYFLSPNELEEYRTGSKSSKLKPDELKKREELVEWQWPKARDREKKGGKKCNVHS